MRKVCSFVSAFQCPSMFEKVAFGQFFELKIIVDNIENPPVLFLSSFAVQLYFVGTSESRAN